MIKYDAVVSPYYRPHAPRSGDSRVRIARRGDLRPASLDIAQRDRASIAGDEPDQAAHLLLSRFQLLWPQQRAIADVSGFARSAFQAVRPGIDRRVRRGDGD